MLHQKTGYPEENELVLCTITKVHFNSVFSNLDEYNKSGMIHISEVAPGRIRNIRDYVKEGKKVICKVLRVNEERGHIDMSLRRVTEMQRREKSNGLKQEQKAEKIIEQVAKKLNKEFEGLFKEISQKIFEKYASLNSCFEEVVSGNVVLEKLGIEPSVAKELTEIIKLRIKPPEVKIGGHLKLTSYASEGVEVIKEGLKKAVSVSEDIKVRYLGAGKFSIDVTASDYKTAEKLLEKATTSCINFVKQQGGEAEFVRTEK